MGKNIQSGEHLTRSEATSIIVGHGVGSGILAVPYLASRNSWRDILLVIAVCYFINLLMHWMIAELSFNNDGAQFITCFDRELFRGKWKKVMTGFAFVALGLSVLVNISGFLAGSSAVLEAWLKIPSSLGMIVYYALASVVVLFGLKWVGVFERISVLSMVAVIGILLVAVLSGPHYQLPNRFISFGNVFALYGLVSFSLSAVMSVPQVVKGLGKDRKQIRFAIAAGTGINAALILVITFTTLIGCGTLSENGALVDLAMHFGGWVSVIGYIFSLLALSTSFWANALNLRDIVHEQTKLNVRVSYFLCTIPCLLLALFGFSSFVGFTRIASVIQVLTGVGIIISYARSRKRIGESVICGVLGTFGFRCLVICGSLLATVGALIKVQ